MTAFTWSSTTVPTTPSGHLGFRLPASGSKAVLFDTNGTNGTSGGGSTRIFTSTDGSTWSTTNLTGIYSSQVNRYGEYSGTHFVYAVTCNPIPSGYSKARLFYYSTDGATWSGPSEGAQHSTEAPGIMFSGLGQVFAPQSTSNSSYVNRSSNGSSWTNNNVTSTTYRAAAANSSMVLWGINSASTTGLRYTTSGGWGTATWPSSINIPPAGMTWNGSVFCLLNTSTATALTSPSGNDSSWTTRTLPVSAAWTAVVSCGGSLLALCNSSTAYQSDDDGASWSAVTLPYSVAYGGSFNGKFLLWSGTTNKDRIVIGSVADTTKNISFTFAESMSYAPNASRTRQVETSASQNVAHSASASVYRSVALGYAQSEAFDASASVLRTTAFALPESEDINAAIVRNRRTAASISEAQALSAATKRARTAALSMPQTEGIDVVLARARAAAFALAESEAYTFGLIKIKSLAFQINEAQGFSYGSLRRARAVSAAISEVTSHGITRLNRGRTAALSVAQTEVITETVRRVRALQAAIVESMSYTMSAARQRAVQATIAELEAVAVALVKVKLLSFVIAQSENDVFFVSRARRAVFAANELEAVQASFNRSRAFVVPINEGESFSIDFKRLRKQVLTIAETQGVSAALARLRQVIQSISNTTSIQFTVTVSGATSREATGELNVTAMWEEWEVLNGVHMLVPKTIELTVPLQSSSEHMVSAPEYSYVVVPEGVF